MLIYRFIEDCHTSPLPPTTREALMCFWGHKFEGRCSEILFLLFILLTCYKALSTLPDTWDKCSREQIERRYDTTVNNNVQYCAVVRTKLDGITLLIAGEVDCIWDVKPSPPENPTSLYVELKTAFADRAFDTMLHLKKLSIEILNWCYCLITNSVQYFNQNFIDCLSSPKFASTFNNRFQYSSLKCSMLSSCYNQCLIVIVGFRTENGFLSEIETYETHALLSRVRRSRDGLRALAWTAALLRFLRKNCTDKILTDVATAENQSDTLLNAKETETKIPKEAVVNNIFRTAISTDNTNAVSTDITSTSSAANTTALSLATVWRLSYTSGDTVVRLERVKTQCFLHPSFISYRIQRSNKTAGKDVRVAEDVEDASSLAMLS
ncbi:unnamed protein product [Pneumocystis jirovecii]|uniref:Decapping nuclease n=1 Tax=Pneumocystis jirovecii TaxID=42068 RepID=L0PCJ1_PNEJI|nr:unnamed protein product [Pneumocystis jirovecii]